MNIISYLDVMHSLELIELHLPDNFTCEPSIHKLYTLLLLQRLLKGRTGYSAARGLELGSENKLGAYF